MVWTESNKVVVQSKHTRAYHGQGQQPESHALIPCPQEEHCQTWADNDDANDKNSLKWTEIDVEFGVRPPMKEDNGKMD
jgi:hypothetical protein